MKRVLLLAVGGIKERFFKEAVDEYAKRLSKFCSFSVTELPELPDKGGKAKEAEHIIKHLEGRVILFDRLGSQPSSEEFASLIDRAYVSGQSTITFVIGGSEGVSDEVRKHAHDIVSFGCVTYPHRLMRVIAVEQIYRAFTITQNLPYHK